MAKILPPSMGELSKGSTEPQPTASLRETTAPAHAALVRGDDGGLTVRHFDSTADATAACAAYEPPAPSAQDMQRNMTSTHAFAHEIGMHPKTLRRAVIKYRLPAVDHGAHSLFIPNRICRLIRLYGLRGVAGMSLRGEL